MSSVRPLDFISRPAMLTTVAGSAVLMGAAMWGWWALDKGVRARITGLQLGTLIFFVMVMIAMMLSIGYSRIWANVDGVTVRNMLRAKTFNPEDVLGVRLRPGDPWAFLLLRDPNSDEPRRHAVLAIQSLEGKAAKTKVLQLRQWVDLTHQEAAAGLANEPATADPVGEAPKEQ